MALKDGTLQDYERAKFVESPTRPSESAVEVVGQVTVVDGGSDGTSSLFYSGEEVTSPGMDINLISEIMAEDQLISRLEVSCRIESVFTITINGSTVGIRRTSAASPNASFEWSPKIPVVAGDLILVTVKARTGSPIVDSDAFLMALSI